MNEESKHNTDPTALENHPVIVRGFERGWFIHVDIPNARGTYLGIRAANDKSINAVVYALADSDHLRDYDQREAGYCRVKVTADRITRLDNYALESDDVWIYVPKGTVASRK